MCNFRIEADCFKCWLTVFCLSNESTSELTRMALILKSDIICSSAGASSLRRFESMGAMGTAMAPKQMQACTA